MDDLKKLQSHLRTWLGRYRQASEIAPAVQEAADEVDWQIDTLASRPPEAQNVSTAQLDEQARLAFLRVSSVLPQMPEYPPSLTLGVNSITTSSSSAANSYILCVADIGTPSAVSWANQSFDSYRTLQEAHRRHERVRELIARRFPTVLSRFDSAVRAYQQNRVDVGPLSAAALEMRTLLDGVQGELLERARKSPGERMSWSTMSERLASTASGPDVLRSQETVRASLYSDLSAVAKQRGVRSIENLWTRTLDHLFVVLGETE